MSLLLIWECTPRVLRVASKNNRTSDDFDSVIFKNCRASNWRHFISIWLMKSFKFIEETFHEILLSLPFIDVYIFHFRHSWLPSSPLPFLGLKLHSIACACLFDICCRLSTQSVPVSVAVPSSPPIFQRPPRRVCHLLFGRGLPRCGEHCSLARPLAFCSAQPRCPPMNDFASLLTRVLPGLALAHPLTVQAHSPACRSFPPNPMMVKWWWCQW